MNLLFLKKKKASLLILFISVLFFSFNSIKKVTQKNPFQILCESSDAYYLHSYTDVTYAQNWSSYKRYISVNNKLVVNKSSGVEKYAFLNLSEYESNHLKNIKIRTLKANGSIIELDSSLVFKKKSKNKKFEAINYPIPGVEPGDTIETSYVIYENILRGNLMSYVSLHTNLPSINSQYSIKSGPELLIRYKSYNDFPKPKIVSNDSLIYLQFSMNKVKGFEENEISCFPCELPYLYYSLEKKNSKIRTWIDVYNEEFNISTQPISIDYQNSSYYKRWKRKVIKDEKDSSKFYKLNLLFRDVLTNFKMKPAQQKEFIKSTGYFLKEKRFDPFSIQRFYRQILEDLEIDYWAVFGRSKRAGSIDPNYIRKGEYDHIFFAYENEKGSLSFLYPHSDFFMYQIDEIPTSLYNTTAILVKPKLKEKKSKKDKFISRDLQLARVDSVSIVKITLPGMNSAFNRINQIVFSKVDLEEKKATFKSRFNVSGGLSTELRGFFNMINQNEEVSNFYDALSEFEGRNNTIQIDSITNTRLNKRKPFSYVIDAKGTLNNTIKFINDSLVSFSVDELIQHNQLQDKFDTLDLNYHLDYSYTDNFDFYLDFPCDIEILGVENGNVNFKNDFSEYNFQIKKSKKNQLKLKSTYKVLKDLIMKEDYNNLKLLNEEVKKVKSKRLIIKLKCE